jgi:hypothetical protein
MPASDNGQPAVCFMVNAWKKEEFADSSSDAKVRLVSRSVFCVS